jgi:hypothetical protein
MRFFLFLLILGLWCQGLPAQGVVSERGQAAVRVYNENYVRARESAIAIAKKRYSDPNDDTISKT